MSPSAPERGSRDRIAPGFGRRLAYYLIGIAIGLLLLGFFQQMRTAAHTRQLARPGASPDAAPREGAPPESATRTPGEQPGAVDD